MANLKTEANSQSISEVNSSMSSVEAAIQLVREKYDNEFQNNRRTILRADDRAKDYGDAIRIMNDTLRQIVSKQRQAVNLLQNGPGKDSGNPLLNVLTKKLVEKLHKNKEERARERAAKKKIEEDLKAAEKEVKDLEKKAAREAKELEAKKRQMENKALREQKKAEELAAKLEAEKATKEAEQVSKAALSAQKRLEEQTQKQAEKAAAARVAANKAAQEANVARQLSMSIKTESEATKERIQLTRKAVQASGYAKNIGLSEGDNLSKVLRGEEKKTYEGLVSPLGAGTGELTRTPTEIEAEQLLSKGVKRGSLRKGGIISSKVMSEITQARAAEEISAKISAKIDKKVLRKTIQKAIVRKAASKIPVFGIIIGAYFGLDDLLRRDDWFGFFLNVFSGAAAGAFPGYGTVAALFADSYDIYRNAYYDSYGIWPSDDTFTGHQERDDELMKIVQEEIDTFVNGYNDYLVKQERAAKARDQFIEEHKKEFRGIFSGKMNLSDESNAIYWETMGDAKRAAFWRKRAQLSVDHPFQPWLRTQLDASSEAPPEVSGKYIGDVVGAVGSEIKNGPIGMGVNKALNSMGVPGFKDGGVAVGPEEGYPVTLHGRELIIPLSATEGQMLASLNFNAINMEFNAKSFIFDYGEGSSEKTSVVGAPSEGVVSGPGSMTRSNNPFSNISAGLNMSGSTNISGGSVGGTTSAMPVDTNVKSSPFTGSQSDWYSKIYNAVFSAAQAKGLANPAIIAQLGASQSVIETGYGRHLPANNAFGIKGKGTAGTINAMTSLGPAGFRAYNSVEESAIDYVDFIMNNPRYKNVLKSTSIADAANAIAAAGYAPDDPSYAQKIYNISNKSGTMVAQNQNTGNIIANHAATTEALEDAKKNKSTAESLKAAAGTDGGVIQVNATNDYRDYPIDKRIKEAAGISPH